CVQGAELAVYDARTLDLLKRWQEDLVPFSDVNAIARPQPHSMAALLGDEAEAIPLSLEDPPVVVERVIDQRREHRFIRGIHPFSFALTCCLRQRLHDTANLTAFVVRLAVIGKVTIQKNAARKTWIKLRRIRAPSFHLVTFT